MRPSILHIGGTVYWTLLTRNPDTMVLKDADSTPSVAVRKNGASVGDSVTITKRSATTGIYDCSYNPAAEVEGDVFTLEESATVTGTTTASATYVSSFNVRAVAVERGTDSAAVEAGDATLAKQEEILTQLDVVQAKTDLIGGVSGVTSLLAAAVLEPGTITSFPETLTIGDSYTETNGREIQIPIVDTDGNPISSTGSRNFADATVTFEIRRANETDSDRIITGSATFVDPPGTGTGAPYAVIELPASETDKGLISYRYRGVLTFVWEGPGTDVLSFETETIKFDY